MSLKIYFNLEITDQNRLKIYVLAREDETHFPEELMDIEICSYGICRMIIFTDQVDEILLMQIAKTLKPKAVEFLNKLHNQLEDLKKDLEKTISQTQIPAKLTKQLKDTDQDTEPPDF